METGHEFQKAPVRLIEQPWVAIEALPSQSFHQPTRVRTESASVTSVTTPRSASRDIRESSIFFDDYTVTIEFGPEDGLTLVFDFNKDVWDRTLQRPSWRSRAFDVAFGVLLCATSTLSRLIFARRA
jgi:hypothetical protein